MPRMRRRSGARSADAAHDRRPISDQNASTAIVMPTTSPSDRCHHRDGGVVGALAQGPPRARAAPQRHACGPDTADLEHPATCAFRCQRHGDEHDRHEQRAARPRAPARGSHRRSPAWLRVRPRAHHPKSRRGCVRRSEDRAGRSCGGSCVRAARVREPVGVADRRRWRQGLQLVGRRGVEQEALDHEGRLALGEGGVEPETHLPARGTGGSRRRRRTSARGRPADRSGRRRARCPTGPGGRLPTPSTRQR